MASVAEETILEEKIKLPKSEKMFLLLKNLNLIIFIFIKKILF